MPDFDDDLESQGERVNALAPVVDTLFTGMAGDFRRGNSTDTKVALRQGKQSIARDILGRRRKANTRTPADLPPDLQRRYREVVKFLGPAALPMIPPGLLAHYVRALDALDSFGHMIDMAESRVGKTVMAGDYTKLARQVAALAKAINVSTHSNVMQLAVISELRVEGRGGPGAAAPAARGDDWRQHAMTLDAEDDDAEGDEP